MMDDDDLVMVRRLSRKQILDGLMRAAADRLHLVSHVSGVKEKKVIHGEETKSSRILSNISQGLVTSRAIWVMTIDTTSLISVE